LWATPSTRISRRFISQISLMLTLILRGLALKRPDVMFIEAQPVFTGLAGRMLSALKRRPYVLNVSDLWPDHLLSVGVMTERHPIYRALRWLVDGNYRRAARIIAMSPLWATRIKGHIGGSTPVSILYNGVDLTLFRPDRDASLFRIRRGLPENKQVIAFIGAFTTQNDFDTLLEVFTLLRYREDVICVFAGGGTQSEWVRKKLEIAHLAHVYWLGWLEFDEIPDLWAVAALTVVALRDEPLYRGTIPAKYFEAMASGVPIVAAVQGVAAALLLDSGAGIVTRQGDAADLHEAINRLLMDDDLYKRCSLAGRRYAELHFDANRVVEAHEMLFSDVIARKRHGPVGRT